MEMKGEEREREKCICCLSLEHIKGLSVSLAVENMIYYPQSHFPRMSSTKDILEKPNLAPLKRNVPKWSSVKTSGWCTRPEASEWVLTGFAGTLGFGRSPRSPGWTAIQGLRAVLEILYLRQTVALIFCQREASGLCWFCH